MQSTFLCSVLSDVILLIGLTLYFFYHSSLSLSVSLPLSHSLTSARYFSCRTVLEVRLKKHVLSQRQVRPLFVVQSILDRMSFLGDEKITYSQELLSIEIFFWPP